MKTKIIVIGNAGLCLECCKLVHGSSDYDLMAVISSDSLIQQWSQQQGIQILSYAEYQKSHYRDYVLLSIVNEWIIPEKLIKKHRVKYAINYHDSLLPAYAGINSTTWAILNEEKTHGVTWHLMVAGIDEGEIIQQAKVTITPEDTAHSLNLKCTQQAIVLFKKLLLDLPSNALSCSAQDLSQKSYYGLDSLPQNYGFINGCTSLDAIYRYCRAFYFGDDYPNQITTVKLRLAGVIYLLGIPARIHMHWAPANVSGLYIVADKEALHFSIVRSSYGIEVSLNTVVSIDELSANAISLDEADWQKLREIKKNEKQDLAFSAKLKAKANSALGQVAFEEAQEHLIDDIDHCNLNVQPLISPELCTFAGFEDYPVCFASTPSPVKGNLTKSCPTFPFTGEGVPSLHDHSLEWSCLRGGVVQQKYTPVTSAISVVLLRLFQQEEFLIHGYLPVPDDVKHLSDLVDQKYVIELSQKLADLDLGDFEQYLHDQSLNRQTITKDFYYRYQCIELLTDVGIYHANPCTDHAMPHRLNFIIDGDKLTILSKNIDQLTVNAIVSSLEVLIHQYQKYLNNKTKLKEIDLLSKEDYQKIVVDWNKTDKPYPKDKTIHQLFEEQVAKAPDNVAVVFEKDQLTYAELNAKANQLARYLQSLGETSGLNCTFKLDSRLRGSDRLVIAAKAAIQEAQFNFEPLLTHSKPDSFIALCLDKSLEMIIGILGILKSGAAYVPIDPNYPDERIKYILEDTKAACVLTQSHYLSKLKTLTNAQLITVNNWSDALLLHYPASQARHPFTSEGEFLESVSLNSPSLVKGGEKRPEEANSFASLALNATSSAREADGVVKHQQKCITSVNNNCYQDLSTDNLPPQSTPDDLAYVMYTSGTTGMPKGILISHEALVNRLLWQQSAYDFTSVDKILQKTPYGFDVSVWELLLPMICGAQLILMKKDLHKSPEYLHKIIRHHGVTKLHFVPSMLEAYLEYVEQLPINQKALLSVTDIFCSGEALSPHLSSKFKKLFPEVRLNNLYGPTEVTIDVSSYNDIQETDDIIPIGRPIQNIKFYVLDGNKQLTPVGIIGELYIAGVGVARGYLNKAELTSKNFMINPFASEQEKQGGYGRLYKTGDLVRWLPDGNVQYIGRNDDQIKMNGQRVETGEIEHKLLQFPGIKQACVLARYKNQPPQNKNGGLKDQTYLVAYHVSNCAVDENDLIHYLRSVLPSYMVPAVFMPMEEFPLTINGKLDKKAFPMPTFSTTTNFVAPGNRVESQLCEIWQDVLKLKQIGIEDDFFKLGGDSILSIRVVSKAKHLGINLSINDIYLYHTISKIAKQANLSDAFDHESYQSFSLLDKATQNELLQKLNLSHEHLEDIYPAAYLQTGMFLEQERSINDGTYHDVFSYTINHPFDHAKLASTWEFLVKKHALLRTCFVRDQTHGYVAIQHKTCLNLSDKISIHDETLFDQYFAAEKYNTFDMGDAGLFRVIIIDILPDSFKLIFSFHHVIADGWSIASLMSEFAGIYIDNQQIEAKKLPYYGEFVHNEKNAIANEDNKRFWHSYLANSQFVTANLNLDNPLPTNELHVCSFKLNSAQNQAVFSAAEKLNVPINLVFLALYQVLVSTFTAHQEVIIGLVANNRLEKTGGDQLFGLHLNTIPLKQNIVNQSLGELLVETRKNYEVINAYRMYPYGQIKSDLAKEDDLYQFAYNYVHFHSIENRYQHGQIGESKRFEKTNIPFVLSVFRLGNEFTIELLAHDSFVDPQMLKQLKQYFSYYVSQCKHIDDNHSLKKIPESEFNKTVYQWNQTDRHYPKDKTIHQLFEEQVARTPDHIAVVFEGTPDHKNDGISSFCGADKPEPQNLWSGKQLTYRELNAQANQLARHLRTLTDIQPDSLIALCLDKSLEMIIGILGILKSGAAYVPIDPNYPDERIKYILNDTKAACLLTQSWHIARLQSIAKAKIISLDTHCCGSLSKDNLTPVTASNDLAYVIYTSGTTGQPKGVLLPHKNIVGLAVNNFIKVSNEDTFAYLSSPVFDASIFELWTPLLSGAKLIVPDNAVSLASNIKSFKSFLISNKINVLWLTKSLFNNLFLNDNTLFQKIKYLLVGGEALDAHVINKLSKSKHKPQYIINGYGPTESTTFTTTYCINRDISLSSIPIGKPINHRKVYVLSQAQQLLPIGVIGELYIGGAGLARGYLNQSELTAEKFIANPFATEEDKHHGYDRLYKTGDLVRWLPDGNLEYIGRKDTQVKIRGFRIELSEIESALARIRGVEQAVVINRMVKGEQYLFAYYTAHQQISPELVLEELTQKLPHYMLPAAAVQIDNIPLTLNGKIDINALPLISFQSAQVYIEPRTEQERIVCQAFSGVLLIEKIGIDDDFFKLGGNSIKAIQLAMILQANFDIAVSELFELRTPRKLAENRKITHDLLIDKLKQIKHNYANYVDKPLDSAILRKKERYLAEVASMPAIAYTTKPIKNVLLTGATGFLGCNLLHQLLQSTSYRIYLCVRAKDKLHAIERMAHKYQFYFDLSLEDHFGDRVVYIPCDLEKERIGLADNDYKQLAQNIDSIIHCAALAKHYGIEQVFYSANVQATINLLTLCESTQCKDFHYISTYSVMAGVAQDNETIFTEDDQLDINSQWNSPYNKTKYLGEINAVKWRKKGINSNIYRVGNLACMQNGKVQEDVEDNSFANYVKFISQLGCIADIMDKVEISPADITAQAIVKLFDKAELNNHTFHVFNPHLVRLSELLESDGKPIAIVSFENFIDRLICYLQNNSDYDLIGRFLLRLGWQENQELARKFDLLILQDKTKRILQSLNFRWQRTPALWLNNYCFDNFSFFSWDLCHYGSAM